MTPEREQAIRDQLYTLLEHFEKKKERILLLQYVVEETLKGNAAGLTERIVAKKVYNETLVSGDEKKTTVRTHASNLRDDLEEYYFTKGCNDDVIIRLPKPGYVPQFVFRSEMANHTNANDSSPKPQRSALHPESQNLTVISVEVPTERVPDVFGKLTEIIKTFPGPTVITAAFGRTGSALFYFNCSEAGHQWIRLLRESGELTQRDYSVTDVSPAEEVELRLATTRSRSLEVCFSPPIDCSSNEIIEFKLTINKLNKHAGSLFLQWMVFQTANPLDWPKEPTYSERIELPQEAGTFYYSIASPEKSFLRSLLFWAIHGTAYVLAHGTTFGKAFFSFLIFIDRQPMPIQSAGDATIALYIDNVGFSINPDKVTFGTIEVTARTMDLATVESNCRQVSRDDSWARSLGIDDQV